MMLHVTGLAGGGIFFDPGQVHRFSFNFVGCGCSIMLLCGSCRVAGKNLQ